MPNGGTPNCTQCRYFSRAQARCEVRALDIENPHYTCCRSFFDDDGRIQGPLYAIVCEVAGGAGSYHRIPYSEGRRADTVQPGPGPDTVLRLVESDGEQRDFPTVADYLEFFDASGQEP